MRLGSHHSQKIKEKIGKSLKGRKFTEEWKRKRCGINNPMFGKHHSVETKEKIRQARIGHAPWNKGKHYHINYSPSKKTREKISKAKKGKKRTPETIEKIIAARSKQIFPRRTSIEIKIENELKRRHIPFMEQVPLLGITIVDFLLPNKIIIYCDGDYWHSFKINKGKDACQDFALNFNGYKVFRFWEHEINKSPVKCINQVMKFMENNK